MASQAVSAAAMAINCWRPRGGNFKLCSIGNPYWIAASCSLAFWHRCILKHFAELGGFLLRFCGKLLKPLLQRLVRSTFEWILLQNWTGRLQQFPCSYRRFCFRKLWNLVLIDIVRQSRIGACLWWKNCCQFWLARGLRRRSSGFGASFRRTSKSCRVTFVTCGTCRRSRRNWCQFFSFSLSQFGLSFFQLCFQRLNSFQCQAILAYRLNLFQLSQQQKQQQEKWNQPELLALTGPGL